jgi:hypothetical protein
VTPLHLSGDRSVPLPEGGRKLDILIGGLQFSFQIKPDTQPGCERSDNKHPWSCDVHVDSPFSAFDFDFM